MRAPSDERYNKTRNEQVSANYGRRLLFLNVQCAPFFRIMYLFFVWYLCICINFVLFNFAFCHTKTYVIGGLHAATRSTEVKALGPRTRETCALW